MVLFASTCRIRSGTGGTSSHSLPRNFVAHLRLPQGDLALGQPYAPDFLRNDVDEHSRGPNDPRVAAEGRLQWWVPEEASNHLVARGGVDDAAIDQAHGRLLIRELLGVQLRAAVADHDRQLSVAVVPNAVLLHLGVDVRLLIHHTMHIITTLIKTSLFVFTSMFVCTRYARNRAAIVLSLLFACYYRFLYVTQRSLASQYKEKEAGLRCASEKDISYSGEQVHKSWKPDLSLLVSFAMFFHTACSTIVCSNR